MNAINLIEIFKGDGHKMIVSGDHSMCRCPFHSEKTPSCHVWEDHYHCYGCAAHGFAWQYIKNRDGCTTRQAFERLGVKRNHVPIMHIPVQRKAPDFSGNYEKIKESATVSLYELSKTLGVTIDSLEALGAAWSEEHNAWAFPMKDEDGMVTGVRLRYLDGQKKAVKGSKEGLFYSTTSAPSTIVICEGPTDAASLLDIGLFAVGRPSAHGGKEMLLNFINKRRVRNVVICADNDSTAGMLSARSLTNDIKVKTTMFIPPTKDIREFKKLGGNRQVFETMLKNQMIRV